MVESLQVLNPLQGMIQGRAVAVALGWQLFDRPFLIHVITIEVAVPLIID